MAVLGRHWELHTLTFLPPELVHKTINILCQGKFDIMPDINNTIKSSLKSFEDKTVIIEKNLHNFHDASLQTQQGRLSMRLS